ncbi:GTP cyclohydrolase I FolE, partial [Bacillus thuringiensis]|nr:GTP cyclohydrolase I FolE [Bacillus thuringiensis]
CEHHMLPFFGKAHVAYIPADGKIIGLSKIPRLGDYVSRKLSVQENITHDIGDILTDILNPKGVAVLVEGRHMCVEMRG